MRCHVGRDRQALPCHPETAEKEVERAAYPAKSAVEQRVEMSHREQGPDSLVVLAIVGSAADLVEIKTPAFLKVFRLQRFNQPT